MYNMEISIGTYKCRLEILIVIIILIWVIFGNLLCSCCKVNLVEYMTTMSMATLKEGFTAANNIAFTPEFAGAKTPDYIMNPSTWAMPTLTYSKGAKPGAGVKSIWNRPKQPVPLPKDELDMFATTPFAPECCPNAFSSSTGCACMTVNQYNYLRDRGGNNVPYSEY